MNEVTWDVIEKIFLIAGGLGLFLYGMKMMMSGLENLAGSRMRSILKSATKNRFIGVLVGALITIIIQSSTATTVMIVGFINAGLLNLTQAISLIIGAHIGTTLTAHIISLNVESIAPLFIFLGFILYVMQKQKKGKNIGFIILGIGVLFFGLSVMGDPLKEFAKTPGFQAMLTTFQSPILAMLSGFIFTVIIQSSTAATGILVTMRLSGVALPLSTTMFLIIGINVGTCVTALLASLAGSRESKRAALSHFFFSFIGAVVFGSVLQIFPGILVWFENTWKDGAQQIAMFHTLFNVATAALLIPFIQYLAKFLYVLIPELPSEDTNAKYMRDLDENSTQTPEAALEQAHGELVRMGRMAFSNLQIALDALYSCDPGKAAEVVETEEKINYLNAQIKEWLMHIKNIDSTENIERLGLLLYIASDIERIGDHAENIAEYAVLMDGHKAFFAEEDAERLSALSNTVLEMISLTLNVFENRSTVHTEMVFRLETQIDDIAETLVTAQIERVENGECNPYAGIILTSAVGDLERCADHANNIAQAFENEAVWKADANV
jgi:Na/Pi-cotransporter